MPAEAESWERPAWTWEARVGGGVSSRDKWEPDDIY